MSKNLSNQYLPDVVSPPGETLQEVLDERSMSQADLAERTGRPRKTINEIIKGKAPITPDTALQLERVLGVNASFWNAREMHYQEYLARIDEEKRLSGWEEWLIQFPVADMVKKGWIEEAKDPLNKIKELLGFFGLASPRQWEEVFLQPQVNFRLAKAFESDQVHLAAWLRRGELEAQEIHCAAYDRESFRRSLSQARRLSKNCDLNRLKEICAAAGVAVVFVPQLPKSRVSGATRWLSPTKAVIQLSLRYKTDDHLWFTFFHESAHILLHGKRSVFIEFDRADSRRVGASGAIDADDPVTVREEAEADNFASEFLIPNEALGQLRPLAMRRRISEASVRAVAQDLGIAPGIVVGRLQHLGWLPYTHLNKLKRRIQWS